MKESGRVSLGEAGWAWGVGSGDSGGVVSGRRWAREGGADLGESVCRGSG